VCVIAAGTLPGIYHMPGGLNLRALNAIVPLIIAKVAIEVKMILALFIILMLAKLKARFG